jgi:hypothetical protein
MTLLFNGRMYADQVRSDISLGKIAPQLGTTLMLAANIDPNILYVGTTWIHDTAGDETVGGVALKKWIRTL